MDRRNFIKLSGASLAGLLVAEYVYGHPKQMEMINVPDAVRVLVDDKYVQLYSSDQISWSYSDILVYFYKQEGRLSIYVEASKSALKEVQLSWQYSISNDTKILGDAWERTYGDLHFEKMNPEKRLPWYCIQYNQLETVCFGVKTGCNTFCSWQVQGGRLLLNLDTRNGGEGVLLGHRSLHAADVVATKSMSGENTFATVQRFCKIMCEKSRRVQKPVYGINDWYFAYGNNSAKLILEHTSLLSPLAMDTGNRPFSVIDDGWSIGTDYSSPNEKFGDMDKVVEQIKGLGMRAGLWTRPLLAKPGVKENLFIKNRGQVLDPTIDENIHYVQSLFRLYGEWGFELVKHDYTTFELFSKYGSEMAESITVPGWHFNDRSKTNAEIVLNLYRSIRKAAGNTYLMGCNTISHLSAGVFELYRTGDDTSGKEWWRTKKMGVNTLGFRMPQHRTFYEVDGDCVGLTTKIAWEKNRQWMKLLAESSTALFISAQPEAVGVPQKNFIKECFTHAAVHQPIGEPLDWLDSIFPSKWELNDRIIEFDWN